MTLYMAVTADRYELPVAVESNVEYLASKMGTTANNIYSQISHRNRARKTKRKYESHTGGINFVRVMID